MPKVDRKVQSKKRYLLSFIVGTVIFILVFLVAQGISYLEFYRISNLQGSVAYKIFEDKLEYSLFTQRVCSTEFLGKVTEDLAFQGRIIDDLERKIGKNNDLVLFRKKFYTLIELEHFEFAKIMKEDCNFKINTILFFYSNEEDDLGRSEEAGRVLGVVHQRKDNTFIYSFDINLEGDLIEALLKKYGIEGSPTIVINEKVMIVNPVNIDQIEEHLI